MHDKSYSVAGLRCSRLKPLVTLSAGLFQKFARTTIRAFQIHLTEPMWNMGCLRENMFCLPIEPQLKRKLWIQMATVKWASVTDLLYSCAQGKRSPTPTHQGISQPLPPRRLSSTLLLWLTSQPPSYLFAYLFIGLFAYLSVGHTCALEHLWRSEIFWFYHMGPRERSQVVTLCLYPLSYPAVSAAPQTDS